MRVVLESRPGQPSEEELRTAVHECGHALMALALDMDFDRVEVGDVDGRLGGVMGLKRLDHTLEHRLAGLRVSHAGIAAEEAVFGDYSEGGYTSGRLQNEDSLGSVREDLWRGRADQEHTSAILWFELHRDRLVAVATMLHGNRSMSRAEFRSAWQRTGPHDSADAGPGR